ncbi:hypothetical protein GCM10022252_10610 [Streptosporangium oxazolinicum]|uniref:Abortive phage infection protein C-terminal domain-containing protein n=1 Tax=Streptosporangium oxazolinicum TaxID=909287 RepID=A0ABP8AGB2_9ACTN
MSLTSSLAALQGRDDLMAYGADKGLMLFALQLQFGIQDIDSVAAVALTDGSNDKKCDLVYVDRDSGIIVLAQGYCAQDLSKKEAPANKASDLNTAATWLLTGDTEKLPEVLQSAALEVRDALAQDQITNFYIWYNHNLPESDNVKSELDQVVATTSGILKTNFSRASVTSIVAQEIGRSRLEELYRRAQAPIIVSQEFTLKVPGGFEIGGDKWKAYCTSVSGRWLRDLWQDHQLDLMSPNVRGYLGIVRSERNINYGIKTTARENPARFWIYNNGLTILTNKYVVRQDGADLYLDISGVGVINGGQTTGSLGTLNGSDTENLDEVQVMARFVSCSDPGVLGEIVKYNNTQNKVEATDFRSKDPVQERLRTEFADIPEADYRGGRRGGIRDAIERSKNLLPDNTVAQALAAFHGKPNIAYNETRRIWEEDAVYASIFSEKTTAGHVVFAFSLQRAIEEIKRDLSRMDDSERTAPQRRQLTFLRKRGSISLLVTAIAESMESITGNVIADRWSLAFRDNCSPKIAAERWNGPILALLPFVNQLSGAADNDLKSNDRVREAVERFQSMAEATVEANSQIYGEFASHLS